MCDKLDIVMTSTYEIDTRDINSLLSISRQDDPTIVAINVAAFKFGTLHTTVR
jgi:hypothetical protein